jgi:hypothetical protein
MWMKKATGADVKFSPLTAKVTILSPYCSAARLACQLANKSAALAARSLFVYFERSAACPKLQTDSISLGVCVVGWFREVFWLRRRISDDPKVTQTESRERVSHTEGEERRLTHC